MLNEPGGGAMKQDKLCRMPGCGRPHKAKRFCERHYAQFRNGIIDEGGEQIRPLLYDGSAVCKMPDCGGRCVGRGFCMRHYVQFRRGVLDEDGNRLRPVRRYDSGRACKVADCGESHYGLGFCNKHYERYKAGIIDRTGEQIRRFKGEPDRICEAPDCDRPNHARGLCMKHYHRWLRNGRPDDGGDAETAPAAAEVSIRDKAVAASPGAMREIAPARGAVLVDGRVFEEAPADRDVPSPLQPGGRTERKREYA